MVGEVNVTEMAPTSCCITSPVVGLRRYGTCKDESMNLNSCSTHTWSWSWNSTCGQDLSTHQRASWSHAAADRPWHDCLPLPLRHLGWRSWRVTKHIDLTEHVCGFVSQGSSKRFKLAALRHNIKIFAKSCHSLELWSPVTAPCCVSKTNARDVTGTKAGPNWTPGNMWWNGTYAIYDNEFRRHHHYHDGLLAHCTSRRSIATSCNWITCRCKQVQIQDSRALRCRRIKFSSWRQILAELESCRMIWRNVEVWDWIRWADTTFSGRKGQEGTMEQTLILIGSPAWCYTNLPQSAKCFCWLLTSKKWTCSPLAPPGRPSVARYLALDSADEGERIQFWTWWNHIEKVAGHHAECPECPRWATAQTQRALLHLESWYNGLVFATPQQVGELFPQQMQKETSRLMACCSQTHSSCKQLAKQLQVPHQVPRPWVQTRLPAGPEPARLNGQNLGFRAILST